MSKQLTPGISLSGSVFMQYTCILLRIYSITYTLNKQTMEEAIYSSVFFVVIVSLRSVVYLGSVFLNCIFNIVNILLATLLALHNPVMYNTMRDSRANLNSIFFFSRCSLTWFNEVKGKLFNLHRSLCDVAHS